MRTCLKRKQSMNGDSIMLCFLYMRPIVMQVVMRCCVKNPMEVHVLWGLRFSLTSCGAAKALLAKNFGTLKISIIQPFVKTKERRCMVFCCQVLVLHGFHLMDIVLTNAPISAPSVLCITSSASACPRAK